MGEPQASYGVPDSGYGAPDTGYGAPNSGYGAPPDYGDYGVPSGPADTAVQGGESAMSMIIIPILIAAALFLLFPSVTTVPVVTAAGRKKRDISSDESPAENMISRVQDMYMAILESEECFERIACENAMTLEYNSEEMLTIVSKTKLITYKTTEISK